MGGGKGPTEIRLQAVTAGIAAGLVAGVGLLTLSGGHAEARPMTFPVTNLGMSRTVREIEDLSKKSPEEARERILHVYYREGFTTGSEYAAAARILATGEGSDDQLLAHDLAVAALAFGDQSVLPLVGQTEDGFLRANGLDDRFEAAGDWPLPVSPKHRSLFMRRDQPIMAARPNAS